MTLIRSTLSSMPIYLMSLLRSPRVVSLRLEKNSKGFFVGRRSFGEEASSSKLGYRVFG